MDPDCKRRISRSLGSLDDILVTLERLKQGPGFSHADQEVKVAKEPDATCSPRGQEGQEESRETEVSAERSKSREEEEEEGGEGGGGSRGDAIEEQSPLPSGTSAAMHHVFVRSFPRVALNLKHESRVSQQTLGRPFGVLHSPATPRRAYGAIK